MFFKITVLAQFWSKTLQNCQEVEAQSEKKMYQLLDPEILKGRFSTENKNTGSSFPENLEASKSSAA